MWLYVDHVLYSKTPLTFGDAQVSDNDRISVSRPRPIDWNLQLSRTRWTDRGEYLCVVNSSPPLTMSVYLNVEGW
jgi:hypothetical protein